MVLVLLQLPTRPRWMWQPVSAAVMQRFCWRVDTWRANLQLLKVSSIQPCCTHLLFYVVDFAAGDDEVEETLGDMEVESIFVPLDRVVSDWKQYDF